MLNNYNAHVIGRLKLSEWNGRERLQMHIDDVMLEDYYKIICMDKKEHKPMVDANPKLSKYKFEYWEIVDIPKVESTVSLPMCYEKVVKLFKNINLK